jgi:hypothetical protein
MTDRDWTRDDRLVALMQMPWDIKVTREEDGSYFAEVTEIPDAVADAPDERLLAAEIWNSLVESLAVRLDRGEAIPLPEGYRLPWEVGQKPRRPLTETAVTAVLAREAFERARTPQAAAGDFQLVDAAT